MQIGYIPTYNSINHYVKMAENRTRSSEVITRTDLIGRTAKVKPDLLESGHRITMMRKGLRLGIAFKLRQWMFESPMKMTDTTVEMLERLIIEKENGQYER